MIAWMPGAGAVARRGTPRRASRVAVAPVRGRDGAGDAGDVRSSRCDAAGVAAVLDEHVERLHHAGRDAGVGERLPARDRVPVPGKFFSCASFAFSCSAEADEHGDDREADGGDRDRAAEHESRPAAPGAVLGVAAVDQPLRQQRGRC